MTSALVVDPESASLAYNRLSISAYFASLAALCSALLARMFALFDNLTTWITPSYCIICQLKSRRESAMQTSVLVFDPGTEVYSLQRLEDIDRKSTAQIIPPHRLSSLGSPCAQWRKPLAAIFHPARRNPSRSTFPEK